MRSVVTLLIVMLLGCDGDPPAGPPWRLVRENLDGALLSVWGTSQDDVWVVGSDAGDGTGPLVLRYDGAELRRVETGQSAGTLWWVHGFESGPVYMGGDGGVILRFADGAFTSMATPGNATVFGIWGATPDEVWAVGGSSDSEGGFVWRLIDDTWTPEPSLPADVPERAAIWKVYGRAADDAWFVGSNGVALHWDGNVLQARETGVGSSLFTVHGDADGYVAVGGLGTGVVMEYRGGSWRNATPEVPPEGLSGVCLGPGRAGIVVGNYGTVLERDEDEWHAVDSGLALNQNLHAAWLDGAGGAWAVGGQTFSAPLRDGVLIYRGNLEISEE